MSVLTLTADNFETEVLQSEKPVLVDFWASWCGPCRMIAPIVEELAKEMGDKVVVAKLNVDEEQALAQQYGVMSIPTLILFHKGETVGASVGVKPKEALVEMIKKVL